MPKRDVKGKVLAVDDSLAFVELVGRVLSGYGYEVLGVTDANDAHAIAQEARPDLMLLDATMPSVDGFAVLAQIRGDALTSKIPVLMLTGRDEVSYVQRALGLGADGYVLKPFQIQVLVARVEAAFTKSRTSANA